MNYWTDEIAQLRQELRLEKDKTDQLQREVTRLKEKPHETDTAALLQPVPK